MALTTNTTPPIPPPATTTDDVIRTMRDATAFPLWVENVDTGGDTSTIGGGASGSGSLGRLVAKTISDTVGWRVRSNDPKGFLAALTNSFHLQEKQGVVLATWTPHNLSVQADLGQLSGPQASLAARSKVITEIVVPMLEGLQPLQPDADQEDCDALVALIISNLQKINDEMWRIGGPVVQRVDQLFEILFGSAGVDETALKDSQRVQGQLGALRELFGYGYNFALVNTPLEETHATNFLIIFNYIDMHRTFYYGTREAFLGGDQGFYGTQLILLSRDLDVVAQGVDEVNTAMDSVLLGASEREALRLKLPDEAPLTLSNLLDDGIGQMALTEGKFILQYGGKDGVKSTFIPQIENLLRLLTKLIEETPAYTLPEGFYTPRVQITLRNLADYLQQTLTDAQYIGRDRVTFVDTQLLDERIDELQDQIKQEVGNLATEADINDIGTILKRIEYRLDAVERSEGGSKSTGPVKFLGDIEWEKSYLFEQIVVSRGMPSLIFTPEEHLDLQLVDQKTQEDGSSYYTLRIWAGKDAPEGTRRVTINFLNLQGQLESMVIEFNVVQPVG